MSNNNKELRELSVDELATRRRDLKEESLHLRVQQESGQLENSSRLRSIRRNVARIETILSERRLAASLASATAVSEEAGN
jgi:large subunit ribosomal protein L29